LDKQDMGKRKRSEASVDDASIAFDQNEGTVDILYLKGLEIRVHFIFVVI